MFGVTILGNNSAIPAHGRHPTAQVVTLHDQSFLLDCGEGTQMQMVTYKIRRNRIGHIFISHLHGDHYFGLIGLITSFALLGRKEPLHIYGPEKLQRIIEIQLQASCSTLPFELIIHNVIDEGILMEDNKCIVSCFRVSHRIDCFGFVIAEKKPPRRLLPDRLAECNIPVSYYSKLQAGQDYNDLHGQIISNEYLTTEVPKARKYAYCADTIYEESYTGKIAGADLMYHEATYLKSEKEKANKRYHSTTEDAANVALLACANKLLIGHFSSQYIQLDDFLKEAKDIFPNTQLAVEGATYIV